MRIVGITIPDDKKAWVALRYIKGIGTSTARRILAAAKVDAEKRTKDLTPEEVNKIQSIIDEQYRTEGELRQLIKQNIQRLKAIHSYRGLRHSKGLPVRGQRTRRNTRTVRGNVRHTAGSGKRKVELK